MTARTNILPRRYSLKGQIVITRLMTAGRWQRCYPLASKWSVIGGAGAGVQFVFVARKKMFKHAVDRNRCKRLMREAFRLNAQPLMRLCEEGRLPLKVAVLYVGQKIEGFTTVEHAAKKSIAQLTAFAQEQIEQNRQANL